ncbi:MAG: high potential iron sulfur protein [Hyphomicrobiales bacterium]|nr:high potential iron sulfur protein [Hyphomicrobiales bacterium]
MNDLSPNPHEHPKTVKIRLHSPPVSRRGLLRCAARAAAGAAVAGSAGFAVAKGKRSKADVEYQDTPHGIERCEICAPFLPPDQCRTVVGPVSRQGWCKIYEGV